MEKLIRPDFFWGERREKERSKEVLGICWSGKVGKCWARYAVSQTDQIGTPDGTSQESVLVRLKESKITRELWIERVMALY